MIIKIENPVCRMYDTITEFEEKQQYYKNIGVDFKIGYRYKICITAQTVNYPLEVIKELLEDVGTLYINPSRADDNE